MATITEARGSLVEAADGGLAVQFITPGVGSSGYYSPDVLKEAAGADLFPAGMQLYINHPSASERRERPERDIMAIGAVSTSPGVWNEKTQAVEASIKVFEHHAWLKDPDFRKAIGLSIRADGIVSEGEHDGRRMPIVEELTEVYSTDFVTKAGRGGKFLESKVADAILASESSANDRREALSTAVRDSYGNENNYPWVLDWDDEAGTVYFEIDSATDSGTYSQTYTSSESGVSLTGSRVEVRRVTNYVPVRAGTDETTEGETVPPTDAELAEVASARDAAKAEAEALKAEVAALKEADAKRELNDKARKFATDRLAEAKVHASITPRVIDRAMLNVNVKDGALDEAAFGAQVDRIKDDEVAYAESFMPKGAPKMTGGGHSTAVDESAAQPRKTNAWGRPINQEN